MALVEPLVSQLCNLVFPANVDHVKMVIWLVKDTTLSNWIDTLPPSVLGVGFRRALEQLRMGANGDHTGLAYTLVLLASVQLLSTVV